MEYTYKMQGVCASLLRFELRDGRIHNAAFEHGCDGNLKGICSLIEGMSAQEVTARLTGICCDSKNTSCPDQLARCVAQAAEREQAVLAR